jgi:hypothetical protein
MKNIATFFKNDTTIWKQNVEPTFFLKCWHNIFLEKVHQYLCRQPAQQESKFFHNVESNIFSKSFHQHSVKMLINIFENVLTFFGSPPSAPPSAQLKRSARHRCCSRLASHDGGGASQSRSRGRPRWRRCQPTAQPRPHTWRGAGCFRRCQLW